MASKRNSVTPRHNPSEASVRCGLVGIVCGPRSLAGWRCKSITPFCLEQQFVYALPFSDWRNSRKPWTCGHLEVWIKPREVHLRIRYLNSVQGNMRPWICLNLQLSWDCSISETHSNCDELGPEWSEFDVDSPTPRTRSVCEISDWRPGHRLCLEKWTLQFQCAVSIPPIVLEFLRWLTGVRSVEAWVQASFDNKLLGWVYF